jgi:hypothetical protein
MIFFRRYFIPKSLVVFHIHPVYKISSEMSNVINCQICHLALTVRMGFCIFPKGASAIIGDWDSGIGAREETCIVLRASGRPGIE